MIAQLVERDLAKVEVAGSSPVHRSAGWSSSVARLAHNQEVAGSNPVSATTLREEATMSRKGSFFDSFFERSHPHVPASGPVVVMGSLVLIIILGVTTLVNALVVN